MKTLVLGAGIIGISTAWHLLERGHHVTIVDRQPDAAHDAIRASIEAKSGDGILARSRAFLEAQIATRSLTPQEGSSADAVLSRMEEQLRQGNLAGAIDEAGKLPPDAAAAMSGWLEAARARNAAVEGMATLDATLSGTN